MPLAGGLLAVSASLLVAAAQGPAGDRDDGHGRHQHLTTVVTPLRGHGVRAHGDPEQASSMVLRLRNDVDAPSVASSSPPGFTTLPSTGQQNDTTTTPITTGTPTTATTRVQRPRAAAGSSPSHRRAGGAPATAAGAQPSKPTTAWPSTLLIPPAPLPTPAVIVPASSGLGTAPVAATAVAVLVIGGLLGIRLARRPG
jgi:hypothetical protein